MAKFASFEKLIVRKEAGYVCDESSFVKLAGLATFDTAMFKLTAKVETCLLLLASHTPVDIFTIDVVVSKSQEFGTISNKSERTDDEALALAWDECQDKGCSGMITLAHVDESCLPNNGSRVRYNLAQFVDALVHGMETYFMFQKFSPLFMLNAAGLWDVLGNMRMKTCYIIMAWKLQNQPQIEKPPPRLILTQLNPSSFTTSLEKLKLNIPTLTTLTPSANNKRRDPPSPERSVTPPRKRGRPSLYSQELEREPMSSTQEEEEEDTEITFKVQPPPVKFPEVKYSPDMTPTKPSTPAVELQDDTDLTNITFGFESAPGPKTPGRKSTTGRKSMGRRKSLVPEWPGEEQEEVLRFFDQINPKTTEQARIALACKFVTMKYDREMPSKLLYQWVQKKKRIPHTPAPGTSYDLPEARRKEAAVALFHSLDLEHSETSRVAFTCKFFQTQYGVVLQSKQLYDMLSNKGSKTKAAAKKRR